VRSAKILHPAARADANPAGESSMAKQSAGSSPNRWAAVRHGSGLGLPAATSSALTSTGRVSQSGNPPASLDHDLGTRGNKTRGSGEKFDLGEVMYAGVHVPGERPSGGHV
jgi:hypothetical protein